ncbi:hypothetical protein P692DRAFT_20662470, partial [Suillus brevipes Sb2]
LLSCIFIGVLLHILGSLSRRNASFLLIVMGRIVTSSLRRFLRDIKDDVKDHAHILATIDSASDHWPTDIRTAMEMIDIDPDIEEYVCCPKDHSIYGPLPKGRATGGPIPDRCSFRETPSDKPCDEPLFDASTSHEERKPRLLYMYQPFKSWLGRLFRRPDICRDVRWSLDAAGSHMYDIWDGAVLRNLKGPDGRPFVSEANNPQPELHLVFSMFIDWFNPFGSKQGGPSTSIGAIYLICHNLPAHLRYKLENVYLAGIIPGPREPYQHHLNHLL